MTSNYLNDNWGAAGNDYASFVETVEMLASSTYLCEIQLDNVELLSLRPNADDDGKVRFNRHKKRSEIRSSADFPKGLMVSEDSFEADYSLLDELKHSTKLMMRLGGAGGHKNDIYLTSRRLCRDLAARAGLAGTAIYEPSYERDAYIMQRYTDWSAKAKAVIRYIGDSKDRSIHKIFAMPSADYAYIDQNILFDMVSALEDKLGCAECRVWSVDHSLTRIWLAFPDHAADISATYGLPDVIVPCVLLETSNTGDCSLRAVSAWEARAGVFTRVGLYERAHRGHIDTDDVIKKMSESVLSRYTEMPEHLAELMMIDIDPVEATEYFFRTLHADKGLGKQRASNLRKEMIAEMPKGLMSAYEYAMRWMEIPSRFEGEPTYLPEIEKLAGKVVMSDFKAVAKIDASVTLMPAV